MKNKLNLLFCDYFQDEISWLLKSNPCPDVEAVFYQADCDKFQQSSVLIEFINQQSSNAHVIIFSSFCLRNTLENTPQLLVQIEPLEVCFELLLPFPILEQTLATGAHLFTNGMLKRWEQVSQSWGGNNNSKQAFFAEGATKLILLTSPSLPADIKTMEKVAAQLNLPCETLEISLDYLNQRIFSVIQRWRDKINAEAE